MKLHARRFWHWFLSMMLTLAFWSHAAVAFAQRKKAEPEAQKEYVMPYILVILCIALGLLVVCRGGSRSTDVKMPGVDDESHVTK
jgi:hypothetical protein